MHQEPPVEWPIVPNSEPEGMFPNRLTKVRNVTGLRSLPTRDGERRCQWPANPSSLTAMSRLVTRALNAAVRRNGWSKSKSWNHLTRRLDAASATGSAPRVLNRETVPRDHRDCDCVRLLDERPDARGVGAKGARRGCSGPLRGTSPSMTQRVASPNVSRNERAARAAYFASGGGLRLPNQIAPTMPTTTTTQKTCAPQPNSIALS